MNYLLNKVLLEKGHIHCLCIVYGCFHARVVGLSSCDRNIWSINLKIWPIVEKKIIASGVLALCLHRQRKKKVEMK